ncbi:E3 ubiquitin-protein ligase ATL4 [Striga hermonthica]|uniref:E3 ubiquitin-protein ligase ATL4 n=1 Tax=Striga hermonthica TaxID=68872 RepID=A0A9N7P2X0_STRHE|nr:E3 ubiquitin-protein ligase ATL4 [Striga hermonthica]
MPTQFTPPPAAVYGGEEPSRSSSGSSLSIGIIIIILASAIIASASIYLIRRRRCRGSSAADPHPDQPHPRRATAPDELLDSLPLFDFRSVAPGAAASGDCAVCLSRFEPRDRLRLLPLCCHAFHVACIDAWIASSQTCPLCRSPVLPSGGADALGKILSADNHGKTDSAADAGGGRSFRIEIGNVSSRHPAAEGDAGRRRRSYSVGSFEYILDDNGYEVPVGSTTHSGRFSDFKPNEKDPPTTEAPAAEGTPGGRSRLWDYVDRLASISSSSRSMSFRSSSRFFSGSSRRTEAVAVTDDLEAYRAGEEISELFRWLSGV